MDGLDSLTIASNIDSSTNSFDIDLSNAMSSDQQIVLKNTLLRDVTQATVTFKDIDCSQGSYDLDISINGVSQATLVSGETFT